MEGRGVGWRVAEHGRATGGAATGERTARPATTRLATARDEPAGDSGILKARPRNGKPPKSHSAAVGAVRLTRRREA